MFCVDVDKGNEKGNFKVKTDESLHNKIFL